VPREPLPPGLHDYLATLFDRAPSDEFLELRYGLRDGTFGHEFLPVHDYEATAARIRDRTHRADVYVGCSPRSRRAGTRDAITAVHALWAECDGLEAARAALRWRPAPAMVVASGSGPNLHAYWPLEQPVSPAVGEGANLRLARVLGADAACFDASRILRPPGTWNHKHARPRPVALLRLDPGRRFELDEIVGRAPEVELSSVASRWRDRHTRDIADDPLLQLKPDVYVAALLGQRPGRSRKVACPFHEDENPSLHVYATPERGWTCFSCRRGGTVYDMAAALWGLGTRGRDFLELRRRLVREFSAELDRSVGAERD
jgi:hypothetical protein